MSFCPKCKSEYINGRKDCADCGVLLVESLDDILKKDFDADELYKIKDYTEADDNSDASSEPEDLTTDETPDSLSGDNKTSVEEPTPERIREFVSQKDKFKDYQSTGYMFVIMGILGIVVMILNMLGIITVFHVFGAHAILFYTVTCAMFVIFIFIGINSFKNASKFKSESVNEDNFINELREFIDKTFTPDKFAGIDNSVSDEEVYFNRTEIIKQGILEKFPEIDPSLLEQVVDESYDKLF